MAIMRIECPECGAGLKSPTGFAAGQSVACPKCETYFTVEEPEEEERPATAKKAVKAVASRENDEDDDKPKKKSRDEIDDDEDGGKSYKNSPVRFIVLGILVVIMVVLGIMLIMKNMKEKEQTNAAQGDDPPANNNGGLPFQPPQFQPPPIQGVGVPGGGVPNDGGPKIGGGGFVPKGGGIQPPLPPFAGGGNDPIAEIIGHSPRPGSPESVKLLDSLRKKLIGSWEGTAPDGSIHKVKYQDNGQFTHEVSGAGSGSSSDGTWNISGLVGTRGVKINRGGATLKAVFEGDELLHDSGKPGVTVVLKKK